MEALPALPTGLCGSSSPVLQWQHPNWDVPSQARHNPREQLVSSREAPLNIPHSQGHHFGWELLQEWVFFFPQLSCGANCPLPFPTDGASIKFRNPFFNRTFTSAPCRAIKAITAELSKESWEPLELSSHVYGPGNVCFIKDSGAISERLRSVLPIKCQTPTKEWLQGKRGLLLRWRKK